MSDQRPIPDTSLVMRLDGNDRSPGAYLRGLQGALRLELRRQQEFLSRTTLKREKLRIGGVMAGLTLSLDNVAALLAGIYQDERAAAEAAEPLTGEANTGD